MLGEIDNWYDSNDPTNYSDDNDNESEYFYSPVKEQTPKIPKKLNKSYTAAIRITSNKIAPKSSPKKKATNARVPVITPLQKKNLAVQLEESWEREATLHKSMNMLIENAADDISLLLEELRITEVHLVRPEVERWIMRNEELETRCVELTTKNNQLFKFLTDSQKMHQIKSRQLDDQSRHIQNLRYELEKAISVIGLEYAAVQDETMKQVMDTGEKVLTETLSLSHECMYRMRNEINATREQLRGQHSRREKVEDQMGSQDANLEILQRENQRMRNDLEKIEKSTFRTKRGEAPDLNCSLTAKTIIRQIENIHLEDITKTASQAHLLENITNEATQAQNANMNRINEFWDKKKSAWQREKVDLQDELYKVKEIATRDMKSREKMIFDLRESNTQLEKKVTMLEEHLRNRDHSAPPEEKEGVIISLRERIIQLESQLVRRSQDYVNKLKQLNK